MYVVALDPVRNRVVVGEDGALACVECIVERCNWVSIASLPERRAVTVRIRSQHKGAPAIVEPLDAVCGKQVRVRFVEPERAVTPGQAAVFYNGNLLLGGGWIASAAHSITSPSAAICCKADNPLEVTPS
ncbi:MAG: hypothetical protein HZB20_03450 [Chloroflexi bacterium]|nr:hypothetical protein [Chloroflexota bacterium]